jgi:hypothetical protein
VDPVGKLIKVILALALSGLVLYFFGSGRAHGSGRPKPDSVHFVNPGLPQG